MLSCHGRVEVLFSDCAMGATTCYMQIIVCSEEVDSKYSSEEKEYEREWQ